MQPPVTAGVLGPLDLCGACGAAHASSLPSCGMCGADRTSSTSGTLGSTERWARLECQFRCTNCGTQSPVNHLDLDGVVDCAHCGLEQSFDVGSWSRTLAVAHDVVDLAATDPSVRDASGSAKLRLENPYHHVGAARSDRVWSEATAVAGRSEATLRVSPGHPVCSRCRVAFHADTTQPGIVRLTCPQCSTSETHQMPANAPGFYPGLAGVAASAHRTDLAMARSQVSSEGAASVTCPQCGAPLPTDVHSTIAACGYCRVESLISRKLWFRLGVSEPRTEAIWLLFRGRSAKRKQLESRDANVDPFEQELQARARAALAGAGGAPVPTPAAPPAGPPPVGMPAGPPPVGMPAGSPPIGPPPIGAAPTFVAAPTDESSRNRALLVVVLVVALVGGGVAAMMALLLYV